jgi:transcriptional regulator with XRE-family HTH domain
MTLGQKIRSLRESRSIPLRKAAALLDIDTAVLSKLERGLRAIPKEMVPKLANLYSVDQNELMVLYLSERILYTLNNEETALQALKMAEEKIRYNSKEN